MKMIYQSPELSYIALSTDDILTASGDNDAPFIKNDNLIDDGWSKYY